MSAEGSQDIDSPLSSATTIDRLPTIEALHEGLLLADREGDWRTTSVQSSELMTADMFGDRPTVSGEECLRRIVDARGALADRVDLKVRQNVHVVTFLADEPKSTEMIILGRVHEVKNRIEGVLFLPVSPFKVNQLSLQSVDKSRVATWTVQVRDPIEVSQYWFSKDRLVIDIKIAGKALSFDEVQDLLRFILSASIAPEREPS